MAKKQLTAVCIVGLLATYSCVARQTGEVTCANAGPQSPRDIDKTSGENRVTFQPAPPFATMKLCDIHFHKFAEHRATGYPTKTGTGDQVGFACRGQQPTTQGDDGHAADAGGCRGISLGDTVEVHWVFTTCDAEPGPSLGSCLTNCVNPQLRVEARVFYLTDGSQDELRFADFAGPANVRLPPADGAVEYLGSTTGPQFNREGVCSALQATWNVGPTCLPLAKASLDEWCRGNVFEEDHAHGVRSLVEDPRLLSKID